MKSLRVVFATLYKQIYLAERGVLKLLSTPATFLLLAFYQGIGWLEKLLHLSACSIARILLRTNQIPTRAVRGAMFPALTASEHWKL